MAKAYTALTNPAVTALNSLASVAYWVSAAFDNSSDLAYEVHTLITIGTTSSAGATGDVQIYVAESVDGGTNFTGGITSEVDATYTPTGDDVSEWELLGSLTYTSETSARTLEKMMKYLDPTKHYKYVIYNNTGTALASSGCAVEPMKVTY